jgi:hypothetical protein
MEGKQREYTGQKKICENDGDACCLDCDDGFMGVCICQNDQMKFTKYRHFIMCPLQLITHCQNVLEETWIKLL